MVDEKIDALCSVIGVLIGVLGIEDVQQRLGKFGEFCHKAYWPTVTVIVGGAFFYFLMAYLS